MADSIQNYMRMNKIFGPNQQSAMPGQINLGQPSMQDLFQPSQEQEPEIPTIPSRQFPQRMPTQPEQPSAWDEFLQSVMNPPQRTNMTYPESTNNVLNAGLKIAATPTAYDKNRVYIDGNAFQKQKTFTDSEGKQRFITDVKKPSFMEPVMQAWSQQGTAATDILNQPHQDAMDDWKLRTEGLKTVAAAEANQALAQQRIANANIGIPGVTGARVMDAQTRARLAQLRDLPDSEKLRLLQEGRVTIAELQAAAAMDRTTAQQTGANQRVDAQQAGANARVGTQQAGANSRNQATIAGANSRNQATIAGAMARTNAQQAGANARNKSGGVSETQGKVAQQRVANELIDEFGLADDVIVYDTNGFPLIGDDVPEEDKQFLLEEFARRLNQPAPTKGTTPPLPTPPKPRVAPGPTTPTLPQPAPSAPTSQPAPAPQTAAPVNKPVGKVRVTSPDGRTGTWDLSAGPVPKGYTVIQ